MPPALYILNLTKKSLLFQHEMLQTISFSSKLQRIVFIKEIEILRVAGERKLFGTEVCFVGYENRKQRRAKEQEQRRR